MPLEKKVIIGKSGLNCQKEYSKNFKFSQISAPLPSPIEN